MPKLNYKQAIRKAEEELFRIMFPNGGGEGYQVKIFDYSDRDGKNVKKRPWCGVRVAEVSVHTERGGCCWMQSDLPHGLAVCAQTERYLLSLVENWPEDEQEEERWRLAFLFREEKQSDEVVSVEG